MYAPSVFSYYRPGYVPPNTSFSARAATAPADRSWSCTACGAHHETWRSVCESCSAFGTLQWRAPGTYGQILPPEARPAIAAELSPP